MARSTKKKTSPRRKGGSGSRKSSRQAGRSKASSTSKRPASRAAQVRQISRKLEKEQARAEASSMEAARLAARLEKLKEKCPHKRLELDHETGETVCKDCFSVVGYPAFQSATAEDADSHGHDLAGEEEDEPPFQPTTDEEMGQR